MYRWRLKNLLICLALALASCGSDDRSSPKSSFVGLASCEEIVERYNQVWTQARPDMGALLPLYHIENDLQRRLFRIERMYWTVAKLDHKFLDAFNEHIDPAKPDEWSVEPVKAAARLIEQGGGRGRAVCIDSEGKEFTLHVVQIEGTWWISGYTLEHVFERVMSELDREDPLYPGERERILDIVETDVAQRALSAERLLPRIESGEVRSAAHARAAF